MERKQKLSGRGRYSHSPRNLIGTLTTTLTAYWTPHTPWSPQPVPDGDINAAWDLNALWTKMYCGDLGSSGRAAGAPEQGTGCSGSVNHSDSVQSDMKLSLTYYYGMGGPRQFYVSSGVFSGN